MKKKYPIKILKSDGMASLMGLMMLGSIILCINLAFNADEPGQGGPFGIALGIFCSILGIIGLIIYIKWISSNDKIGLTINETGFQDHSNMLGNKLGFVEWGAVKEIRANRQNPYYHLTKIMYDPDSFIRRFESSFSKRLLKLGERIYGRPFAVGSLLLKCSFEDLEKWMQEGLSQSHKK